jgi:hypothetical protein
MVNYENAKIYKLWSPEGEDIYIGSTIQMLCQRKAKHFYNYKNNLTCKSKIIYEKYNDVRIELLECCPCDNKEELHKKEGQYIRNNSNCVNKRITMGLNLTKQEKVKLYNENCKEKNSQKITCDCGSIIRFGDIKRHEITQKHLKFINK